jgi:hypothetical protein
MCTNSGGGFMDLSQVMTQAKAMKVRVKTWKQEKGERKDKSQD